MVPGTVDLPSSVRSEVAEYRIVILSEVVTYKAGVAAYRPALIALRE